MMRRFWIVTIIGAFGVSGLVCSTGCQRHAWGLRGARCRPTLPGLSIFRGPRAKALPDCPPPGAVAPYPGCGTPPGYGSPQTVYDPAGPIYSEPPEQMIEYPQGAPGPTITGPTTRYAPVWPDDPTSDGAAVVIPGPEAAPAPSR